MTATPKTTLDQALRPRGALTALALRLQISKQYLCEIRKGRREPPLGLAFAIERETGIPASSLILNQTRRNRKRAA